MVTPAMERAFHRMQEASVRAQEADNPVDQEAAHVAIVDASLDIAICTKKAWDTQDDAEVLREDK